MYLATGLGQPFKQRSPYKPDLRNVTVHWTVQIPFRKDFQAFRQELVRAIGWPHSGGLLRDATDKKHFDGYLQDDLLKAMHKRLLQRRSPKLKEDAVVNINVDITFSNVDYTGLNEITVKEQR